MHQLIKATSLAIAVALCSACTKAKIESSEPETHSEHVESNPSLNTETQTIKSEVETAEPDEKDVSEVRSAESHTHGDASLAVVLEGSKVTVELETPLYNLLGFEHDADTQAQKAAIVKAESVLSDQASIFVFNSEAGCAVFDRVGSVELDVEHGHENHDEDEHDEHEDKHHDDHDADDETHKDLTIQYEYMCSSPKALKTITVNLFEHFENLSELDLVYLGPNTQKQETLNAARPRMNLIR